MIEQPNDSMHEFIYDRRRGLTSRQLLNWVSLGVAAVIIVVSAPWWLSVGQGWYAQIFPPSPYRGALVYDLTSANSVQALRPDSGAIVWHTPAQSVDHLLAQQPGRLLATCKGHGVAVCAFDSTTGKTLWRTDVAGVVAAQYLGGDAATIIVLASQPTGQAGNTKSTLFAFDAPTGTLLWQHSIASTDGIPLIAQTVAIVADESNTPLVADHVMTAYDLRSGGVRWRHTITETNTIALLGATQDRVIAFTNTFLVNGRESVIGVDLATGVERWRLDTDYVYTGYDDGIVYFNSGADLTSPDAHLTAIDAHTGAKLWQTLTGYQQLGLAGTFIPATSPAGIMLAYSAAGLTGLDVRTSKELWPHALPLATEQLDVSFNNATMLRFWQDTALISLNPSLNDLNCIDMATGVLRWKYPLSSAFTGKNLAVAGNYGVIADNSRLVGVDLRTGHVAWNHPDVSDETNVLLGAS